MDMDAASTYIEQYSSALCQAIYDSLDEICGKKDASADMYLKQLWTTEMTSAFERKQFYFKKWRKASGLNCLKFWLKHQETNGLLQRLIQKRRREITIFDCFSKKKKKKKKKKLRGKGP